jgi:undecaprenyl-diphosphatase
VNPFDAGIIHFFNQFARHSWTFDNVVVLIAGNNFIKGGVMMSLLWWMWFREGGGREQASRREIVLFGLFSSFAALIVARFFAHALPFRERPLHNPDVSFQMPYGMNEKTLIHWSSFPSDHAVLFFALAATIFFVSKRAGLLALCHAVFVVCLPRIYLGLHYPTDIVVGALLGVAIASLSQITVLRHSLMRHFLLWLEESPGTFYAFLFLVASQTAELFTPIREIMGLAMLMPGLFMSLLAGLALIAVLAWRASMAANLRREDATSSV